jgi:tetratricopeptide (TPR) repeat protein
VSQGLAALMGGDFALRGLDPIRVKGKERPVEVCLLEGSAAAKGRPCEPAIKKGAIFGREAELAAVATAWKKTRSGRGAAVLIVGEAGVGKTTVLEHAVASISRRNPILRTACYEYLQAVPYAPWVELLEQAFGTIRTETIDARTGKVRAWLGENAPHLEEFAALLNPIMAVSLEMGDVVRSLDGRARRERLHSLVGDLLVAAGRRRAHAIVLEDLHWADESTLALLRDVSPALGAAPVLLLATARPCEGLTELRPVAQALDLEELSAADSAAMVRAALGRPDLHDVLVDFVYEKTRGNPLFTEEVTRELALPGVLDRILHASAVNLADEVAALGIPDRVQGLFMSQIDRLSPETREVAKAASVVGRMFTKDELRGMGEASLGATSLDAALSELAASSLVLAESSSDGGSYRFRHALVQQVAYDSLPFARRRELHSAVARFIEAAGAVPDDGVLVHHYRNAGDRLELRSHATRAAQSSMAAYGYREAVDYLDLALGTVRGRRPVDANARSRLHELSADCHGSLGSQDQAISNYVRALHSWKSPRARSASLNLFPELPSLTAPDEREAELCRKIALAALRSFTNQEEALRWANRAEACVPQDRPGLASEIAEVRTVAFCRAGRYQDALKMGEESLVLARQSGDEALLALALNGLANACIWLGLFARGVEACTEGVRLCQKTGDLSLEATAHCNLAICYDAGGDFAKALHHHQLSLALSRRLGDMTAAARTETNISALYLNLSSPAEAAFYAREAIGHQGEDAAPNLLGCAWLNLGRAQVLLGDTEDAQSSLARARALLRKANASGILLDVDLEEARLDLVRGDVEAARSKTKVVLVGARQAQSWFTEIDSLLLLGSLELKAQDVQAAREAIDAALARAGEMGADHERGRGLLLLAELQAGAAGTSEEPATALATLDEARALFRRMGAKEDLAQTRRLRARIVRGRAANR